MLYSLNTLLIVSGIILLVGFALGSWITRLLLRYPFGANPMTGKEALIGRKGKVVNKKDGYLRVAINSQVWTAESPEYDILEKNDLVLVKAVDNLTLGVVPLEKPGNQINLEPQRNQVL